MRITGLVTTLGAILLITVTGCASTVSGEGRAAAGQTGSEQSGDTGEPSDSTEPSQTTESTQSGNDELDCPDESVSPAGAPYCYTTPDLDEVDLGDPTAGEEGSFRTSYGFGPTDHIDVQAYAVAIDTDELSDEDIIAELAGVIADLEAGGFVFDDEPTSLEIDDARAFAYEGASTDGTQDIVTHFIFRGLNEVQVNCASIEETDLIDAACAGVLDSLQIVG